MDPLTIAMAVNSLRRKPQVMSVGGKLNAAPQPDKIGQALSLASLGTKIFGGPPPELPNADLSAGGTGPGLAQLNNVQAMTGGQNFPNQLASFGSPDSDLDLWKRLFPGYGSTGLGG